MKTTTTPNTTTTDNQFRKDLGFALTSLKNARDSLQNLLEQAWLHNFHNDFNNQRFVLMLNALNRSSLNSTIKIESLKVWIEEVGGYFVSYNTKDNTFSLKKNKLFSFDRKHLEQVLSTKNAFWKLETNTSKAKKELEAFNTEAILSTISKQVALLAINARKNSGTFKLTDLQKDLEKALHNATNTESLEKAEKAYSKRYLSELDSELKIELKKVA